MSRRVELKVAVKISTNTEGEKNEMERERNPFFLFSIRASSGSQRSIRRGRDRSVEAADFRTEVESWKPGQRRLFVSFRLIVFDHVKLERERRLGNFNYVGPFNYQRRNRGTLCPLSRQLHLLYLPKTKTWITERPSIVRSAI